MFGAHSLIERREYETYVAGVNPTEALPEMVGIGFLRRAETVRAEAIEALQTAMLIHEQHGNRPAQQNTQRRLEKLLQVN